MMDFKNKKYFHYFNNGFSLPEVMVAVGIISFISLSLINIDKIFQQGVKQQSGILTQQKFVSAVDKLLFSVEACNNTFGGLNPTNTTPGSAVRVDDLVDDGGTSVLSRGDYYGGISETVDLTSTADRLRVTDMYISHFGSTAGAQFNRADEFTFTVVLERNESERVRTITEHFRVRATLDASSNVATCLGEPPIDLVEVCALFQGTYDATNEVCRSIYAAEAKESDAPDDTRTDSGAVRNNTALHIENTDIDIYGSTVLERHLTLGGETGGDGELRTTGRAYLRDNVFVGNTTSTISGRDTMSFRRGMTIGMNGSSISGGLVNDLMLSGSIITGRAFIRNAPSRNNNSSIITAGLVREMLSELLSHSPTEATQVLTDASNAIEGSNPVGDNAINYLCSGTSYIRLRTGPGSPGFVRANSVCNLRVLDDTSFLRENCQIDSGESAANNQSDCQRVWADQVYVGTNGSGNRIDEWSINEFTMPPK